MRVRRGANPNPKGLGAESDESLASMASVRVTWSHGVRPDVFGASSMALSIGVDAVWVSMLPYGPWSRYPIWLGHGGELVRAWLGWSSHGLVFSMLFGACWGWNVAFVRKGLSDGLSWVSPDELSGLTGKSV